MVCRITQSSDAHRTETVSARDHEQTAASAEHHRPLDGTHCAYPWRDDQAELTLLVG